MRISLMRIRDPEYFDSGSGMEKIRIRDKRPVSATLPIRDMYCLICLIANYYIRWRGIVIGLSRDGRWADFSKLTTAPLSIIKTFRMSLISAGSISVDSIFKVNKIPLHGVWQSLYETWIVFYEPEAYLKHFSYRC